MATLVAAEEKQKKEAAEKEEAEWKKREQEEKEQERKEAEKKRKANVAKNRRKEPVIQPAAIRSTPTASSSKRKSDEVSDLTDSELSRKKKSGDSEVDEGKLGDWCDECRGKSEECRWPTDACRKTCLGCSRRKTVCMVDGVQVSGYKSRASKSKAEIMETVEYEDKIPLRRMQKFVSLFFFF